MKKLLKKLATIAAAIVAAFGAFSFNTLAAQAEDSATKTTSVMEDLQADATFSKDAYPSKTVDELKAAGEELLQVIRIGESVNAELYIYVYQPSDATKEIVASKLLIGQTASDNDARVLPLKLVSSEGVFDKYLVEGIEVLPLSLRHYQITSIFRPFDAALDAETGNDNVNTNMAVPVAQTWYARNSADGKIEYAHTTDEVITITDEWHGHLYYSDGWKWVLPGTDSHFVAFSTDHVIEKLKNAEIYFNYQYVNTKSCFRCLKVSEEKGAPKPEYVKLSDVETGGNAADGWFAHKYSWNRIEPITDFINENSSILSEGAKNNLQEILDNSGGNGAWILRFFETSNEGTMWNWWHWCGLNYTNTGSTTESYHVNDVAILKLTFETNGTPYTLGVVDSMTSSDHKADGGTSFFDGIRENIKDTTKEFRRMMRLIGLVFGAVLLVALVALLVYGVVKLVTWARMNKFFKNNGGGSGKPPIDKGGGSG